MSVYKMQTNIQTIVCQHTYMESMQQYCYGILNNTKYCLLSSWVNIYEHILLVKISSSTQQENLCMCYLYHFCWLLRFVTTCNNMPIEYLNLVYILTSKSVPDHHFQCLLCLKRIPFCFIYSRSSWL